MNRIINENLMKGMTFPYQENKYLHFSLYNFLPRCTYLPAFGQTCILHNSDIFNIFNPCLERQSNGVYGGHFIHINSTPATHLA